MTIGKRSGVARGTLNITAPLAGDYWAFFDDGVNFSGSIYSRNVWSSDRTNTTASVANQGVFCINTDSANVVGDGSLGWINLTGTEVDIWDVAGNALYSYVPAGSRTVIGAGYEAGYVYWIEFDALGGTSLPCYLMRARADLSTGLSQIGSHTIDGVTGISGGPATFKVYATQSGPFALSPATASAAVCYTKPSLGSGALDLSFTLSSGTGSDSGVDPGSNSPVVNTGTLTIGSGTPIWRLGIPADAPGVCVGGALSSRADGPAAAVSALWTIAGASDAQGLSVVGSAAIAYDGTTATRAPVAVTSSATDSFAPANHPTLAVPPTWFFGKT